MKKAIKIVAIVICIVVLAIRFFFTNANFEPIPENEVLISETDAELERIKSSYSGPFSKLLTKQLWKGSRLAISGIKDNIPQIKEVQPWNIKVSSSGNNKIALYGFSFSKDHEVQINLTNNSLIISGTEFPAIQTSGHSPMFQQNFNGFSYKLPPTIGISGSASILFLENGNISLDFHKVMVGTKRLSEYGVLKL